jgi:hypothetical protein
MTWPRSAPLSPISVDRRLIFASSIAIDVQQLTMTTLVVVQENLTTT